MTKIIRWTPTRKALLCEDILLNRIEQASASTLHDIPYDELETWIVAYKAHGTAGLAISNISMYRRRKANGF